MKEYFYSRIALIFGYFLAYFAPVVPLMLTIGFFVLADFFTGVLAARKRGEQITSSKMRPTVMKGLGYMSAIVVAHVFQMQFLPGFEVMKIVAGLIAFMELKSLDENIRVLTGKSLFKQFMNK